MAKSPLGVIYFTVFISMIGFGIVIPVLPVYAKSEPFLLNPTQLGWLVGIFSLVQLFSAPIIGKLSDRFGRKPVLLVSIIGTAIGYFITGAASAAWMLFLGRIIDGASGGNIATAQACIADVTPKEHRSRAMGHIGAAFGLGFIMGPVIGGLLSHWGAGVPFYAAGALSLLNALFVIFRLPETLDEERRLHPAAKAPIHETFRGSRGRFIATLLGTALLSTTGFAFIHVLFALFCADHFSWNLKQISYAFAYVGVLAVFVQGGLLRHLLRWNIEKELAIAGASLLAVSLWLMPRTRSSGEFLWVCALMALGNGLVTPVLSGMASRHVHGRAQGRVLGLMAAAGSLGRFLGPALAVLPLPPNFSEFARPLTGSTFAAVNSGYRAAFTASAGLVVLAAILALFLKVPKDDGDVVEAPPVA
ncbi:MAG TPA: MFS transporter [Chthoniobacteraceae bacterium]|nr:MFS transporter [Chthoniobacteraceae bacterium]